MIMVLRTLHILALTVLLATANLAAQAQQDTVQSIPGIEISTTVDKAEVFIGDLIRYSVSITHDSSITLVPPPLGANLGAFDVKDYEADVETKLEDGRIRSTTTFVLSTFTTGDYIIPPVPVAFEMPDKMQKVMLAEAVPIRVKSMLENAGDSADIRPLKAPYEFERNWVPYYVAGALLLLGIAGFLLWLKFRKKPAVEDVVDMRPAWEIAYEKLALLKAANLMEEARYKEYYIELTEIVRAYLGRMYDVTALDMTTEEFLCAFRQRELPPDLYDMTSSLLHHADLVKFARYVPAKERAESDFMLGHDIVRTAYEDYESRQQAEMHIASQGQPTATTGGRP